MISDGKFDVVGVGFVVLKYSGVELCHEAETRLAFPDQYPARTKSFGSLFKPVIST